MVEQIGDRIKKLRKMHNFTQQQVAEYLGFKQTQIAKLENNDRKLKSSSLNKLCELYNCPKEYILSGIGEYSKEKFKFRSSKDLDLDSLANMNRIIRNLKELNELNGD
ncbi:MAG: helix-turn-helix transcriptional regulator [Methanobrevibacter sp.]|uniref:helix-turn-helix domain-containing protein n=1 Tax=Methanobrevibacter sp. TaxID=66852 RepID=UPI0025E5656D|nr:helix-turn-helix transcriptional regulator [Methanobrevibacter sp.]MBQ8017116.1 helix-turn-helix transcriptional regulator [Methanobrevibacter sp.]